jgi:hypothetical protein
MSHEPLISCDLDRFDDVQQKWGAPHLRKASCLQVLGDNLLSLIKLHNYRGIPIATVKQIARQVLKP